MVSHFYNTSLFSDEEIHFVYHLKPTQNKQCTAKSVPEESEVERLLNNLEVILRAARPDIFNMDAQIF
jgi:hypothetical protein